ncbi:hypothetical protein SCIP_0842 [Scardovia inopinata JCM 12537]|nr:hypothetical protein SCIP_0842 [Scardovia inopinata JCM 12537]
MFYTEDQRVCAGSLYSKFIQAVYAGSIFPCGLFMLSAASVESLIHSCHVI